jgi:MerR family transcriptional regulator, light-induced transcriptional regulator
MAQGVRTHAAAAMLGVSASTLRSWERRHGYPRPRRTPGNHRLYELTELEALRDALTETGSITSAIEMAQRGSRAVGSEARLLAAFDRFDDAAADREMEEAIAVRSVERAVDELMLPALEAASDRRARGAELDFGCRWATGWLHRARSLAPVAWREEGVLILEAQPGPNLDSVHAQALELALRRAGLRVLSLSSAGAGERIGAATAALAPRAIVVSGGGGDEELRAVALRGVLRAPGAGRLFAYRAPDAGRNAESLEPSPVEAAGTLLARLGET